MPKLDDFFKKRLENINEAPDGWNIPSELPWEAAKEHFPKPKKKRRILIWLFAGMVIMAGAFIQQTLKSGDDVQVGDPSFIMDVEGANTNISSSSNLSSSSSSSSNTNTSSNTSAIPIENKRTVGEPLEEIETSLLTQTQTQTQTQVQEQAQIQTQKTTQARSTQQINKSPINSSQLIEQTIISVNQPIEESIIDKPYATPKFSFKTIGPTMALINNKHQDLPPLTIPRISPIKNIYWFREVGVSHKLSPFSITELDFNDGMDQVLFRSDYSNFNLHYAQSWGRRWSISSGLTFTKINAGLDFVGFFNYDRGMVGESLSEAYETGVDPANTKTLQLEDIPFISGLEPSEGELLNVRGALNLNWNFVQVPVIVNYRWIRPKMEYHFGAGLNIGYYDVQQSDVDLAVYRDDLVISENPDIEDLVQLNLDITPILQTGFKRKITPHFKLGLNIKYDLGVPLDSGIELGIFYRWHK